MYFFFSSLSLNCPVMASRLPPTAAVAKRLLDSMQDDLRKLSAESKRKHPEVKEVSSIFSSSVSYRPTLKVISPLDTHVHL